MAWYVWHGICVCVCRAELEGGRGSDLASRWWRGCYLQGCPRWPSRARRTTGGGGGARGGGALLLRAGERVWERGVWGMLGLRAGVLAGRWENGGTGERVGEHRGGVRQAACGRRCACAGMSGVCVLRACVQGEGGEAHLLVKTGRSRCLAMRGPGEGRGRRGGFPSSLQA